MLKRFPIDDDEGNPIVCRIQDLIEFICTNKEERIRLIHRLKAKVSSGGFPNPHSPSTKAIRLSILEGSKRPAHIERARLQEKLKDADEGQKRNTQKAIGDLDHFIDGFRDDVIRENRNREPMALRDTQRRLTLKRLRLTFNSRVVAVFKSEYRGQPNYGGAFLQVTDESPFNTEGRCMIAYLLELLLKCNYATESDTVMSQFCYVVDIPGNVIVESLADSEKLHQKLLNACKEFAELWDSKATSVTK